MFQVDFSFTRDVPSVASNLLGEACELIRADQIDLLVELAGRDINLIYLGFLIYLGISG